MIITLVTFQSFWTAALLVRANQVPFVMSRGRAVINDDLRSFIDDLRERWNIPGLTLGIVRPDGEVETEGFGVMNERGHAVTPEVSFVPGDAISGCLILVLWKSLFYIGSCSKAFTSAGYAALIAEYAS